jgi:hypothetical protein
VQNFSYVPAGFAQGAKQASYVDIQIFMDVTRSFMESVSWIERYFWFGAMYEMASSVHPLKAQVLIAQQGVNDLNSLFDLDQEHRRSGALSELGVQYAGSNGTIPTRDRWGGYSAASSNMPMAHGMGLFACVVLSALL